MYSDSCNHPDDLRGLARRRSPTDLKSVVTPSSMKGKIMNENNRNKRVYMKPNKPATEMTEEEIHAFAEEMYNRIMGTLPERKVDDEK